MAKKQDNTNIIALGFESLDGAENMLANVHVWQDKGFFTVKDAVVVTRGSGANDLEIKQTVKKTGKWALGGGGIGFLAGMLLGGPVGGLIVGATVGAISGALKDSGIDDNFIHVIGTTLRSDTSALLIMVEPNPNRDEQDVMKELGEQRATVLSTTLAPEREKQLRDLLAGKGGPAPTRAPEATAAVSEPVAAPSEAADEISAEVATDGGEATPEASSEPSPEASSSTEVEEITPSDDDSEETSDVKTPA